MRELRADERGGSTGTSAFGVKLSLIVARNTRAMERSKRLEIRVSAEELERIQQRAVNADKSVSDFVRAVALDKPLVIKTYDRLDPADLAQVKRLGNLLNQIALATHTGCADGGTSLLLDAVLQDVRALVRRELASNVRGRHETPSS